VRCCEDYAARRIPISKRQQRSQDAFNDDGGLERDLTESLHYVFHIRNNHVED